MLLISNSNSKCARISIGQPKGRARIGRCAHQAIEKVADLRSETLGNRIARQLQQQANGTHARRVQLLAISGASASRAIGRLRMRAYSACGVVMATRIPDARQQRGAFQRRRDAELIGVVQLLQLALQMSR